MIPPKLKEYYLQGYGPTYLAKKFRINIGMVDYFCRRFTITREDIKTMQNNFWAVSKEYDRLLFFRGTREKELHHRSVLLDKRLHKYEK